MKKDIEWLISEIDQRVEAHKETNPYKTGVATGLRSSLFLIDQLDEPKVLSQEFIDKHSVTRFHGFNHGLRKYIPVEKLQNLFVPKQEEITEKQAYNKIAESFPATSREIESVLEKYYSSMLIEFSEELHESITKAFDAETTSKTIEVLTGMTLNQIVEEARNGGIVSKQKLPVVPKYVADWISIHYKQFDLLPALKRLENNALSWEDVYEWYRGNTSKFVNAYLTGEYETEKQKYVIKLDDEVYLQKYEIDNKNIVTPFRITGYLKEDAIKFDDRKKAEIVAELVVGKVEALEE